jgi:hypothetical protein
MVPDCAAAPGLMPGWLAARHRWSEQVGPPSTGDRRGGRSSPDAIGLISWNEFSENTHVEPSREYGFKYLELLADLRNRTVSTPLFFDSDENPAVDIGYGRPFLTMAIVVLVGSAGTIIWRLSRKVHDGD